MAREFINPEKIIWKHLIYALATCVFGICLCVSVCGLDRDRTVFQFHHTAWTIKDGVPGQIRTLAQTNDGYLWLGTSTGLYRFDGVIFDRYETRSGDPFPSNNIYTLMASPDGGLWIGYWYGGVSFLKDGNLTNYGEAEGLPQGRVQSFARDNQGTIWAAAAAGGLARLEGLRWQKIGTEWNYPGKAAQAVFLDRAGTLWVATERTVVFLPEGARSFQSTNEQVLQVLQITQSPDGTMWMAETSRSVRQIRQSPAPPRSLGPEIRVGSVGILFDRDGALWITSIGDGLRRIPFTDRFRGRTIARSSSDAEIFTEKDGLSADYSSAVLEDREGNVWIGTANGLDRFREGNIVPIRFPPGYQDFGLAAGDKGDVWTGSSNQGTNLIRGNNLIRAGTDLGVSFVFRDNEGIIWMNATVGIFRVEDDKFLRIKPPSGIRILGVSSAFKDTRNALWFYLDQEGLFRLKDGFWTQYERQAELPKSSPITGAIDSLDRKWFGYAGNLLAVIDGEHIRTFSRDDGLEIGDVKVILERNGRILVGGTLGLAILEKNRFRTLVAPGSENFTGVSGIIKTPDGAVWLNESRGIVHIAPEVIERALEDKDYMVRYRLFDYLDGMPGTAQQNRPFPTAIEGTDGRLWFATNKAVVWLDPRRISANPVPPSVFIRTIRADEKSFEPASPLELPERAERLRIEFTALSLSIPERVRFRYRLDGVDKEWQDAGVRREAFYTNLNPGNYRFRVIACNNDGVWNESGASLEFTILPAFYQTLWFRILSVLAVSLLIFGLFWLFYKWRISQATEKLNARFEERLAERTRIAQELHDTLLQGFLGITMRLQAISNILPVKPETAKENLESILNQVDTVIEEGRRGIWGIRASAAADNDLAKALALAGEELRSSYPASLKLTVEGESRALHPLVRDEVYRIAREALTNAFRHSRAAEIEVGIEFAAKRLKIFVRDDGCGINPKILSAGREGHLGLSGMREAADRIDAKLDIWSRTDGGGTEIELSVPDRIAFKKPTESFAKPLTNLFTRKIAARDSNTKPEE